MTSRSILIVEDEPIVQLHLQRIVAEAGHRVSGTAATAAQAREAADREAPDLVLMDIHLPGGIDGVDAARQLRDKYDCAVVFATAYADSATLTRTASVGASGYVTKPFSNAEVRAAITTAFANHERLQQARERERSLASILVSMGAGILMTDERGAISFANLQAGRLTGCDAREACGRDILEVVHFSANTDAEEFRTAVSRSLAKGQRNTLSQLEITGRDGSERIVDVEVRPLVEQGRQAPGLIVVLRDRTRRKKRRVAAPSGVTRAFGAAGTRLLVYSHDTFGLGHLQRCLNLVRALLARHPGLSVLLVTGSPVVHRFELPKGADYVKLPTVRKVGPERYEARSLLVSDSDIHTLRSNLLLRTVRDYDPNVLLVDHAPVGVNGEILPALEWLQRGGRCTSILGLRDIVDEPRSVVELWNAKRIYDVLRDLYDHVFVYGAPHVYDPVALYEFPDDVAAKTHFVHYVCDASDRERAQPAPTRGSKPLVAVSIGGGDGGAEAVIGPFLEMLKRFRADIDFRSEVVTGPLVSSKLLQRFRQQARDLPVAIRHFVPSTTPLFRAADLVISTGGYNTTTQLLAHARRAVVIPRILHRHEQLIRARRMQELGLMTCLHPREVDPERLFRVIQGTLGNSDEPLTRGRARRVVPLDGAERVTEFCSNLRLASTPSLEEVET